MPERGWIHRNPLWNARTGIGSMKSPLGMAGEAGSIPLPPGMPAHPTGCPREQGRNKKKSVFWGLFFFSSIKKSSWIHLLHLLRGKDSHGTNPAALGRGQLEFQAEEFHLPGNSRENSQLSGSSPLRINPVPPQKTAGGKVGSKPGIWETQPCPGSPSSLPIPIFFFNSFQPNSSPGVNPRRRRKDLSSFQPSTKKKAGKILIFKNIPVQTWPNLKLPRPSR